MARKKLLIDTDPGIDDAMAILAAFNSEEVEIVGLTTIFGNVQTAKATENAFILRKLAGQLQVPVAEGSAVSLTGLKKERVADFVHGHDGFGNTNPPLVQGTKHKLSAAEFIVDCARRYKGELSVLALGPFTNVALAFQLNASIVTELAELIVLGGAFFVNGNVNPAVEANVAADPEAADFIFGQPCNTKVVGLDVTHKCTMTAANLAGLRGNGRFGTFLADVTQFYLQYHRESYGTDAVYVHDPAALAAVLEPRLFTWRSGQIRVLTEGIARGMSVMDAGLKRWNGPHAWDGRPCLQVAVDVNAAALVPLLLERMSA